MSQLKETSVFLPDTVFVVGSPSEWQVYQESIDPGITNQFEDELKCGLCYPRYGTVPNNRIEKWSFGGIPQEVIILSRYILSEYPRLGISTEAVYIKGSYNYWGNVGKGWNSDCETLVVREIVQGKIKHLRDHPILRLAPNDIRWQNPRGRFKILDRSTMEYNPKDGIMERIIVYGHHHGLGKLEHGSLGNPETVCYRIENPHGNVRYR